MTEQDKPKRRRVELTEEQIDHIAHRAAERAVDLFAEEAAEKAAARAATLLTAQFFQSVGKGVVKRVLTAVGLVAVATVLWARSKGII